MYGLVKSGLNLKAQMDDPYQGRGILQGTDLELWPEDMFRINLEPALRCKDTLEL